jgi:hypothetical protein
MKRRSNKTIKVGRCAVKIVRKRETDEYVVKAIINGKTVGGRDGGSYETDMAAARSTAAATVLWLRKHRRKACL